MSGEETPESSAIAGEIAANAVDSLCLKRDVAREALPSAAWSYRTVTGAGESSRAVSMWGVRLAVTIRYTLNSAREASYLELGGGNKSGMLANSPIHAETEYQVRWK